MKIVINEYIIKNPTAYLPSFQKFVVYILKFLLHIWC